MEPRKKFWYAAKNSSGYIVQAGSVWNRTQEGALEVLKFRLGGELVYTVMPSKKEFSQLQFGNRTVLKKI